MLVATRLYMKAKLSEFCVSCALLASAFVDAAEKYEAVPMPGYSHTQQAMLTTVGHYFASFAEGLLDDADFIVSVEKHIDKNPLGSAAGFGTSIPVDRKFTTKQLGFADLQINSLYCQNSRGKFESAYMESLAQVMLTLGKFAGDILLFTSQEFDFFAVNDSLVTGSSIMPHKKNLDVMEMLRGNVSVVLANQLMIKDIAKNLISGYNRDGQLIKKPLMESTRIVTDSLDIAAIFLKGLKPRIHRIQAKIDNRIFTADTANRLVLEQGIPFREAYRRTGSIIESQTDFMKNIKSKTSIGAPGNLGLTTYRRRIRKYL